MFFEKADDRFKAKNHAVEVIETKSTPPKPGNLIFHFTKLQITTNHNFNNCKPKFDFYL